MALNVVIMAAGKGTRMKSALPKVLHRIGGKALLQHVMDCAAALGADRTTVITGHGAEQVEAAIAGSGAVCVRQMPQLGTGHAVQQAVPTLGDDGTTLILNGDVPLITPATARALVEACGGQRLALLTIELDDPSGLGRILRDGDAVRGIVEHKDATEAQRRIREIYTGVMAAPTGWLKRSVTALKNDNAQREYYLTDVVAMAVADGVPVLARAATSETEVMGVNSPVQLAELERRLQLGYATELMEAGVRLIDPARFDQRGTLRCGQDVEIDVNCVFEGSVVVGHGARIGANCVLRNVEVGDNAEILPFTYLEDSTVGARARVGPFSRLRPGARLGEEVHVGNFVEIKNSTMATGSKANHLAYVGDTTVGERVNYGAGSITANYDGANKHRTVLGNDVHVGSNCVLVAPVVIGDGATVAAGSTITEDVPPGQLAIARGRQTSIGHWTRPKKARR